MRKIAMLNKSPFQEILKLKKRRSNRFAHEHKHIFWDAILQQAFPQQENRQD